MGVTLMEFGNNMRKGVMYTIRSVWHHPFLVCVVCAMTYMSTSFPLMFWLLASVSPVVVCTALLLATLLYYGQHDIHETETEMKTKYESLSLRNNAKFLDATVLDKNDSHSVDKSDEPVEKKLGVESSFVGNIHVDGSSKGRTLSEIESENGESGEESEAVGDRVHEEKREWNDEEKGREGIGDGEVMADHYALVSKVIGELLESESDHEKSEGDSCDSERGNREEDRHEDEEGSDSGSERAESSSPDESIDDIMPTMLDELHPLLDEEAAQPPQMSHVSSEAALTEHSPRSSNDSADETDVQESEAADDDDDDDNDAQDEKEDHTKSVITWTEEDQKNLMLVGNSEIERNQRLERILRRRRNRSMVPEINLMEYQNSDFQFQITPISTARRNPFDLPQDSGPDSAPSVLSRRRTNPFELPDDLIEEDLNEMGDESRAKLKPSLTRHPFLRRRDNFSARPSIFSPNRLERRPVKIRPFFVAEQAVSDGSSYSPFKRQPSEQSSAPEETESVSSVEYLDTQEVIDDHPSDQDQISNYQETAETSGLNTLPDDGPHRYPVYDTDTSPKATGMNSDDDGMQARSQG